MSMEFEGIVSKAEIAKILRSYFMKKFAEKFVVSLVYIDSKTGIYWKLRLKEMELGKMGAKSQFQKWWLEKGADKALDSYILPGKAWNAACEAQKLEIINMIKKAASTCEENGWPHHLRRNPGLVFADQLIEAIKKM